jgi:hypothetical protein
MPCIDRLVWEHGGMAKKPEGQEEEVTDVLAAEEFALPAPDPALTPEQLDLPADLVGEEARDVLAAEEFAMPAPDEAHVTPSDSARRLSLARLVAVKAAAAVGLVAVAWRVVRRKRRDG